MRTVFAAGAPRWAGRPAQRADRFIHYRLANDAVLDLLTHLRRVAERNMAEVDWVVRSYFKERDSMEPASRTDLLERARPAYEDVAMLRTRGCKARRPEDGLPEWRAAELAVGTGAPAHRASSVSRQRSGSLPAPDAHSLPFEVRRLLPPTLAGGYFLAPCLIRCQEFATDAQRPSFSRTHSLPSKRSYGLRAMFRVSVWDLPEGSHLVLARNTYRRSSRQQSFPD